MLFGLLPSKSSTANYDDFVANQMPANCLAGKTVVITGCTSGTGLIAAKTTVQKGGADTTLIMLNRPSARSQAAVEQVKQHATDSGGSSKCTNIVHIDCDLQDFDSVRKAAAEITKKYNAVHILANNAGVMAIEDKATKDGYDVQMQTNHLSHFLLTKELWPLLKKAAAEEGGENGGAVRIVNHSSMARSGGPLQAKYFGKNGGNLGGDSDSFFAKEGKWERYHQSKLANATYTTALAARIEEAAADGVLDSNKIQAVCAAPGLAATSLQHTSSAMSGESAMMWFAQSAHDGALGFLAGMFLPASVCKNGTFREPWNGWYGKPVEKAFDKHCLDKEQQDMLWKESEAAVGKFSLAE